MQDKDQIHAYWLSKGVDSGRVGKFIEIARTRPAYSDGQHLDTKLAQLQAVLPGVDVIKMVTISPNILVYDILGRLPDKIEQLRRLLPDVDVVKLVSSSPHVLTFNVDGNIAPKLEELGRLLPGINMSKLIRAAPNLLSLDSRTVHRKLEQLAALLPGEDMVRLVGYSPTILYHDPERSIGTKLDQLKAVLPGCNVIKMVCASPPLLCSDIAGSITDKVGWMLGCVVGTQRELLDKLESNPRMLTCGYGVVFGRLEFLGRVKVEHLRAVLLAPVVKFSKDNPSYKVFLVESLCRSVKRGSGRDVLLSQTTKQLEKAYGTYLRSVVNKK